VNAALLKKFAESPARLTTADLDAIALVCGEEGRAVAVARRLAAVKAPTTMAHVRLEVVADSIVSTVKGATDPLKTEIADLKARVLELEAAAAAREMPA
jgi:hypothetical protein